MSAALGATAAAEARKALGESQATFGKRVGLAQAKISKIERGERTLTAEEAIRMADALGVTLDAFFGRDSGPVEQYGLARRSLAQIHEITARFAEAVSS